MATQNDTTGADPKLPTVGLNISSQNIDPLESFYAQNKTYPDKAGLNMCFLEAGS